MSVPKTRLNLNARVGVEKQDDTFAPNTADPNLTASHLTGLTASTARCRERPPIPPTSPPRSTRSRSARLRIRSANTDARVYYGIDGRNVSLNQYKVGRRTGGDAADTTLGSPTYAYVVPQDWLKQNAGAEVGYRLIPEYNTKLTVGYRLDVTDRSNAQVGHSSTNTGSVALSSEFGPEVDGRLSFDYANRSGSLSYLTPWRISRATATPDLLRRLLPGSHDVGSGHAAGRLHADEQPVQQPVPPVQERELHLPGRSRSSPAPPPTNIPLTGVWRQASSRITP